MIRRITLAAGLLLLGIHGAAPAIGAPLLEQLYVKDSVLPGASLLPGFTAADTVRTNGQRVISVSPSGNFVGAVNTDPSLGNAGFAGTFYLFGSLTAGTNPKALRREATISGQEQESFSTAGVDDAGRVTYTATLRNPAAPPTRFASLWEDDALVSREGLSIPAGPLSGQFFSSFGAAARTPAGVSSWVSNYSASSLGAVAGSALFRDTSTFNVLLKSGDAIAGQGTIAAESGAVSSNIRWSASGTHFLTNVDLQLGFTSTDEMPVLDGAALTTVSGAVIREGSPIPAVDGGLAGEAWQSFNGFDVNDSGQYTLSVFTTDAVNDSILVKNGAIVHREGDVVDGVTLTGQVQGVAINNAGDLAWVWNKTLFVNDQKIAEVNTLVDTDGNGVGDAPITNLYLNVLEITDRPAAGGDGLPVVYVAGDVNGKTAYMRLVPDFSLYPDFNADGAVDGADLLAWQQGLGVGTTVAQGDADRDQDVDAADLAMWRTSFGAVAPPAVPAAIGVPEPVGYVGMSWAAALWAGRRRKALADPS